MQSSKVFMSFYASITSPDFLVKQTERLALLLDIAKYTAGLSQIWQLWSFSTAPSIIVYMQTFRRRPLFELLWLNDQKLLYLLNFPVNNHSSHTAVVVAKAPASF